MNKYEVLGVVGEGAYGVVLQCRNKVNEELVAIKKFKDSEDDDIIRKTTLREVKMLRMLRHENIVTLKEAFRRKGQLYLVFQFVEKNLLEVLEVHTSGLEPDTVRFVTWQLVKAIEYCHRHEICHRDIKPENILLNADMSLKVCDFGFARTISESFKLTDYVATRWYRSPELLLGSTSYDYSVDIWAIGCIQAEITDAQPLFAGDSEIDQLYIIQKDLGPLIPSQTEMFLRNPRFQGLKFPEFSKGETLEKRYLCKMSKHALNFLRSVLCIDPAQRVSGAQALQHQWFDLYEKERPTNHGMKEGREASSRRVSKKKVTPLESLKGSDGGTGGPQSGTQSTQSGTPAHPNALQNLQNTLQVLNQNALQLSHQNASQDSGGSGGGVHTGGSHNTFNSSSGNQVGTPGLPRENNSSHGLNRADTHSSHGLSRADTHSSHGLNRDSHGVSHGAGGGGPNSNPGVNTSSNNMSGSMSGISMSGMSGSGHSAGNSGHNPGLNAMNPMNSNNTGGHNNQNSGSMMSNNTHSSNSNYLIKRRSRAMISGGSSSSTSRAKSEDMRRDFARRNDTHDALPTALPTISGRRGDVSSAGGVQSYNNSNSGGGSYGNGNNSNSYSSGHSMGNMGNSMNNTMGNMGNSMGTSGNSYGTNHHGVNNVHIGNSLMSSARGLSSSGLGSSGLGSGLGSGGGGGNGGLISRTIDGASGGNQWSRSIDSGRAIDGNMHGREQFYHSASHNGTPNMHGGHQSLFGSMGMSATMSGGFMGGASGMNGISNSIGGGGMGGGGISMGGGGGEHRNIMGGGGGEHRNIYSSNSGNRTPEHLGGVHSNVHSNNVHSNASGGLREGGYHAGGHGSHGNSNDVGTPGKEIHSWKGGARDWSTFGTFHGRK